MLDSGTRRLAGVIFGVTLIVASCGGDSTDTTTPSPDEPGASSTTSATTAAPGETTTTPAPTEAPGGGSELAPNRAVVTIDGTEYEFDVEQSVVGRCESDFFGAFWVIASAADGSSASLEMFLVPEGDTTHNETSRILVNVEDADGREWHADADGGQGAAAGASQVDSFSVEGNTATGTATFVDTEQGDGATAQGSFVATCP